MPSLAYTVSRAILSDAIALTRGDRLFTADYTSYNLTAWGFADCQRDPNAPGYGSTIGRLLVRALPNHYSADSAYTWFPLMTPDFMQGVLTKLGDIDLYSLKRPEAAKQVPSVSEYKEAKQVLEGEAFGPLWSGRAEKVIKGKGYVNPFRPCSGLLS